MHNSCKPPIVHRDVKSRNILLNEKFQGKLADFGLSKMFADEDDSHVYTMIVGTPGYVDPEWVTNTCNIKKILMKKQSLGTHAFPFGFHFFSNNLTLCKKKKKKVLYIVIVKSNVFKLPH